MVKHFWDDFDNNVCLHVLIPLSRIGPAYARFYSHSVRFTADGLSPDVNTACDGFLYCWWLIIATYGKQVIFVFRLQKKNKLQVGWMKLIHIWLAFSPVFYSTICYTKRKSIFDNSYTMINETWQNVWRRYKTFCSSRVHGAKLFSF